MENPNAMVKMVVPVMVTGIPHLIQCGGMELIPSFVSRPYNILSWVVVPIAEK